jgi:hypothetical protein
VAIVLAVVAVVAIVVEPFPKGFVVLELTRAHGIDAGDLPAILLLLAAALLAVWGRSWSAWRTPSDRR